MDIQFGTETEIGITRQNPEGVDVVSESIHLVRSAVAPGVRMRWDYSCEDPHCDARGFRVKELLQDTDEANYFAQDAQRALTFSEIKSDLVLRNGARFYNDHAHPEYCSPECSRLIEILQQDHAGDALLMACVRNLNQNADNPVLLYKNNTDFRGHSYGCHENYLMPRKLPWDVLSTSMIAFFVSRQIVCGAGKFGWEEEDKFVSPGFQVSQRSDFFSELQSVDTMQRRPIINTRDEPHANNELYRRFHVIVGDANLSLYATWLKIGTTARESRNGPRRLALITVSNSASEVSSTGFWSQFPALLMTKSTRPKTVRVASIRRRTSASWPTSQQMAMERPPCSWITPAVWSISFCVREHTTTAQPSSWSR